VKLSRGGGYQNSKQQMKVNEWNKKEIQQQWKQAGLQQGDRKNKTPKRATHNLRDV
jgi:hypothetical protein